MVFLMAEFYLKESGCYYPLYRFDSSIIFRSDNNEIVFSIIEDIFIASLRKTFQFDYSKFKNAKCISQSSIDSFNLARISFPIAVATNPLKGVYLNFEEFRKNNPTYKEFKLNEGKASDQIYVPGKYIKDSLVNSVWGYCDGQRQHMKIGYNYFPLFKIGKTYELYAPKELIITSPMFGTSAFGQAFSNPASAGLATMAVGELFSLIKTTSIKLKPVQLDLENGRLY